MDNLHWPGRIDQAESKRRKISVFEAALSPVITDEDHAILSSMSAQINMDMDNMVLPTSDGQKYVREVNDAVGGELGYAPHNVTCKMKMKLNTCRNKHGVFTWKRIKSIPRNRPDRK